MNHNGVCLLPFFRSALKKNITSQQLQVVEYFEKYPLINKISPITIITPYSIVYLKQSHFNNGTLRLRKPALYILQEDIIFEPNKNTFIMANLVSCYPCTWNSLICVK